VVGGLLDTWWVHTTQIILSGTLMSVGASPFLVPFLKGATAKGTLESNSI